MQAAMKATSAITPLSVSASGSRRGPANITPQRVGTAIVAAGAGR
jgi:hypothetical protein